MFSKAYVMAAAPDATANAATPRFEGGNALLEDALRGIRQPSVDISRILQAETSGGMGRVMEYVGGRLVDGYRTGICCWIGLLSCPT